MRFLLNIYVCSRVYPICMYIVLFIYTLYIICIYYIHLLARLILPIII